MKIKVLLGKKNQPIECYTVEKAASLWAQKNLNVAMCNPAQRQSHKLGPSQAKLIHNLYNFRRSITVLQKLSFHKFVPFKNSDESLIDFLIMINSYCVFLVKPLDLNCM